VSPDPTSATGTKLVVKNAFPNPFTNFVAINFSVPETGSIRARVYNDQGAVIKTIALGFGFEGDNEIFWDGTNVQGQKVAAGVYMIRLEYLNEIVAQRVILTNY
jgi:flagellar hook assembly protein FlgD